ncbi:MAG: hypothetical protein AAB405_01945 [Patescibacteria group bacterium]
MIKFLNKKDIFVLFIAFYLLLTALATPLAFAADCDRSQTAICSIADVLKILNNIAKWMYTIFFIIAGLIILIVAYSYLTAQGNPETIQKINKQIFYAIIAIVIALLAFSFTTIIKSVLSGE